MLYFQEFVQGSRLFYPGGANVSQVKVIHFAVLLKYYFIILSGYRILGEASKLYRQASLLNRLTGIFIISSLFNNCALA